MRNILQVFYNTFVKKFLLPFSFFTLQICQMLPNFHLMANLMTFNTQTFIFSGASTWFGVVTVLVRGFAITLIGHTTLGRIPLDEWSARRTDLYLTNNNSLKRQISTISVVFEPAIPTSERPQNHATEIGVLSTSYSCS